VKATTHNLILSAIISFVICLTGTTFAQEDAIKETSRKVMFGEALQGFDSTSAVSAQRISASNMLQNIKTRLAVVGGASLRGANGNAGTLGEKSEGTGTCESLLSTALLNAKLVGADSDYLGISLPCNMTFVERDDDGEIMIAMISHDIITILQMIQPGEAVVSPQVMALLAVVGSQVPLFIEGEDDMLATILQDLEWASSVCDTINDFDYTGTDPSPILVGIFVTVDLSEDEPVIQWTTYLVALDPVDPVVDHPSDPTKS